MVLGIRYPKVMDFAQTEAQPAGTPDEWRFDFRSSSPEVYARAEMWGCLPICPARYSEVRKVVFYGTFRVPSGVSFPGRMRMALVSGNASALSYQKLTIAPSTYHRVRGTGTALQTDWHTSHLFNAIGTSTDGNLPVSADQEIGPVELLQVTFDRFAPGDEDFFAIWDQGVGVNDYVFFRPVFERTTGAFGNDTNAVQCANIGVSVVQAPAGVNRTCTIFPVTPAHVAGAVTPVAYTTVGGFGNRNPFHFRYNASQWDNITGVHFLGYNFWVNATARSWSQGLHKINTNEPYTTTLLTEEVFGDSLGGNATGDVAWWRGENLLADLVDGDSVGMLFHHTTLAITAPTGWLEVIQEDFNLTVCPHPLSGGMRLDLNIAVSNDGFPAQSLFDPTWYQALPDDHLLDRKMYLSFLHNSNVNTTVQIFIDQELFSDVSNLDLTAPLLIAIGPSCTATPTATVGRKSRFEAPTIDPINLAGQRKLVWGIVIDSATPADYPGDGGFLYAINVPNTEFLISGDIFEVGEFDPEGCSATSAGLGDPGMLVISNGSTIPKKFDPNQGNITNAGMPTPFPDELPTYIVEDTALSPGGGLENGTYVYRYTIRDCCTGKESDPNPDDIIVTVSGAVPAGKVTFSFANVRVPSDNLCEICIYRSVVGGEFPALFKVGCFDPDETEFFEDQLSGTALDIILNPDLDVLSILNGPMPCVPYIVSFRNRIFGAGDIPILAPAGTVTVANGSNIVIGSEDTDWDRCLEGKYIKIAGDCTQYEIMRVLPPELGISPPIGRLELVEDYGGEAQTGASYEICGHPNRLYFSEPLEPEYWPAISFIDIEPGDGDRIMGLASNFDRLVIYKRRKTYVMTFGETPFEVNVPARVSSDIGMIAPRSPAQIENGTVALAERGLQIFDGRGVQHVPESGLINDLFTDPDNPRYVRRDALGRVMDAVGVFYPKREQYLLFVPTVQTIRGCNLMVVWDTKLHNITFFEFCQEFQSMVVGRDADGNERVYAGDANGFVWALDVGHNDGVGVPGDTGTVRGLLTGGGVNESGISFFEDAGATFLEGGIPSLGGLSGTPGLSPSLEGENLGLAGVCIHYRAPGETVWQTNFIFASTPTRLYLTLPIDFDPTGYEYMLGAIEFEAVFKPFNYGSDDYVKRLWKQVVVHEIEEFSSRLLVELRADFANEDQFEGDIINDDGTLGRSFSMSWAQGKQVRKIERIAHTYMQIIMSNFAPDEPIRLLNHVIQGTPQESR